MTSSESFIYKILGLGLKCDGIQTGIGNDKKEAQRLTILSIILICIICNKLKLNNLRIAVR
jgi:hypothetical protein